MPVLCPPLPCVADECGVSKQLVPPEWDDIGAGDITPVIVILPDIHIVAIERVIAVCDIEIPQCCLPAVVQTLFPGTRLAVFIHMCAEPVAINVQSELCREEIIDE